MSVNKAGCCLFLAMFVALTLNSNSARAHRFHVALVIPLSSIAAVQGHRFREGFVLATTERDGHPDEESDGHLGGLDVYIRAIDAQGDVRAELGRIVSQGQADIVVAFGAEKTLPLIGKIIDGTTAILLPPGQFAYAESGLPAEFILAYERKYGAAPSLQAAQGYSAARRIDMAVRAQGGVDDTASLLRIFSETARGFTW